VVLTLVEKRGGEMKKRSLAVFSFMFAAWLCMAGMAQAQDITNAVQLALTFDQPGIAYPLAFPYEPTTFQPMETLFVDFSAVTNAFAAITNYAGEVQNGIRVWRMRLIQNTETGEVVVKAATNDVELLRIPALSSFVPYAAYNETLRMWALFFGDGYTSYTDLVANGFTFLDPPRVVMDAWVISAADEDLHYSDGTSPSWGRFTMTSEDDSGDSFGDIDPCSISNVFQAFRFTGITLDPSRDTILTWQACTNFIYGVFSTDVLTTNTFWTWRTYLFGQPNSMTWTDTTTTATNIVSRFFKIARKLPIAIAAGGNCSMALRPDGTLWTWGGNNDGGQLGDGLDYTTVEVYRPYPGEVANVTSCFGQTITNAVALAAGGDDFMVVVDVTGTVWTFGEDDAAQLGNGAAQPDPIRYPVPSPIGGISNIVSVATGDYHTLALRADGKVFAWGQDTFGDDIGGVLGAGSLPSDVTNSPIQSLVPTGTLIVAVACGASHSVALDASGNVWGWGDNEFGQIGGGAATGRDQGTNLPIHVPGISNVVAIAAGAIHTIALTADKRVWTWGDNSEGELGRSTSPFTFDTSPAAVTGLSSIVAIAGGNEFTLALTSNGFVYAFGNNDSGELGDTGIGSSSSPVLVAGLSNVVQVSANEDGTHCLAVTIDQGVYHYWAWGDSAFGQVGNGATTNQYSPAGPLQFCTRCQRHVQLGTNGTLHAQCNGTLYLYFNDEIGQFGDNAGSYTVAVNNVTNTVPAFDPSGLGIGIAFGPVTNGGNYHYSASGFCNRNAPGGSSYETDANGYDHSTNAVDCSSFLNINITNAVCPTAKCFSLVGKIQ
jgi:alpha-tubulin suppressor-like RCC1 family protein